ncbi:MAG: ShlB/FhaC/HecB family hemolysin secretion/activation protein [Planctomycetota bacterium]|nr:MAG: ShlB/FhaC/HecB family hemolysin secretion/activation protein [Planctomycetota bacterium]
MESGTRIIGTMCLVSALVAACLLWFTIATPALGEEEIGQAEQIEEMRDEAAKAKREAAAAAKRASLDKAKAKLEEEIAEIDLPTDTTQRFSVRELRISGNSLVSTEELLEEMPLIFNASDRPLAEAESVYLYDFRVLHDVVLDPGQTRQVSARTIQGLTQYILSVYQEKNYAGIYVYVPSEAVREGVELRDEILPVRVLEATVTDVTVTTYDPNQDETEKGYLRPSAVMEWSPVEVGQVANQKKLDDFVNLLNLNPDRYVSAVVTKGREPNTLAVAYDVYEANPWHWFIQVDNSGTKERQWDPRIGVINTNLFGIDDTFVAIYQAPWDNTIGDNYALYGSYDFPLAGPRLRLNLYGGHSEFDISPATGVLNFLGRGSFYGGVLRYNVLQAGGWFLDVKGTLEHTRSKVSPDPFPTAGADVRFWLWGGGIDLHRSDDMSNSSVRLDRFESLGCGSDGTAFDNARENADTDFTIYSASAAHSQYLDANKVHRVSGSFRYITTDERLVPAKMTAFGGMYSVRGYDEYEFVADGGVLASFQYEFDLVKYEESMMTAEEKQMQEGTPEPFLRKLAPLVFFDYGRPKIRHPVGLEKGHEELMSVGVGTILELGDHFTGVVYYGYPLGPTDATREGKGRMNVGLLWRW